MISVDAQPVPLTSAWHSPAEHSETTGPQVFPHPPQLLTSVWVLAQYVPHEVSPAAQMHVQSEPIEFPDPQLVCAFVAHGASFAQVM
ncbi:MAG: hypothetical protein J0H25_08885 [Rhizobiales bacterium]|nr:hypothetical protein [Hyphomicrobiales bacterium]